TDGAFGVPVPSEDAPSLRPAVVLVPLLAFSRAGHRLGYGGGYYDRTLADLRAGGGVLAVGLAYAEQELEELPVTAEDAPLDTIITERMIHQVKEGG
ncbi:MAG TPA: 5-formyltetrahydrofolate cyclo-ligase, partial [Thermopetrobacter sp.]|nr:5-formyltetrahydrofolate cyclo-ligase [Thermopetrobacter sp.]